MQTELKPLKPRRRAPVRRPTILDDVQVAPAVHAASTEASGSEEHNPPSRVRRRRPLGVAEETPKPKIPGGQGGRPIDLHRRDLNSKELMVVASLYGQSAPFPLNGLAASTFPAEDTNVANSWVRNSLRRLVRGGWVVKNAPGTYSMTVLGRDRWVEADDHAEEPPRRPHDPRGVRVQASVRAMRAA